MLRVICGGLCCFLIVSYWSAWERSDAAVSLSDGTALSPLTDIFDPQTQPFAFTIPHLPPVPGLAGIRAVDCGVCHVTIYQDWKKSTHAAALHDVQFQAEITKPDSPKWLCLNCHIPLSDQRAKTVSGLHNGDVLKPAYQENPHFDKVLEQEAITCASCHVRTDDGKTSYIIGSNASKISPHPVRQNPEALRNICQRCHNPQGDAITPNLLCWFTTTDELAKSAVDKDCVDCHMPEEERVLVEILENMPTRPMNRHHWVGGGIPKTQAGYAHIHERGYKPGVQIETTAVQRLEEELQLEVQVRADAGHAVPSGDPERYVQIIVLLADKAGQVLQEHQYRIGQTWTWNPAKKVGDNRLAHNESRTYIPVFDVRQEAVSIRIEAKLVRLSKENAAYMATQAHRIDEDLLPDGKKRVANMLMTYPRETIFYQKIIMLEDGVEKLTPLQELLVP